MKKFLKFVVRFTLALLTTLVYLFLVIFFEFVLLCFFVIFVERRMPIYAGVTVCIFIAILYGAIAEIISNYRHYRALAEIRRSSNENAKLWTEFRREYNASDKKRRDEEEHDYTQSMQGIVNRWVRHLFEPFYPLHCSSIIEKMDQETSTIVLSRDDVLAYQNFISEEVIDLQEHIYKAISDAACRFMAEDELDEECEKHNLTIKTNSEGDFVVTLELFFKSN